jgi:O-acetyl-ADP-ribose deacetylase (regulator of RNase III)
MTSGKWGTWVLIVPEGELARGASRALAETALSKLLAENPNLARKDDITVPLSNVATEATKAARALVEADVVVADVTDARPEILFFVGARDLITGRVTIALHVGEPSAALRQLLGPRLVCVDPNNPAAAQMAASDIIARDLSGADDRLGSELRVRLGAYRVSRTPRVLKKADDMPGTKLWQVSPAPNGQAPVTQVGLWWGDIASIEPSDKIDAIVNSENTYFEMGRMHDRGLSAVIRYLGAHWWDNGRRCDDAIYRELLSKVRARPAPDGTTIITSAGRLREKGIKLIAHVAAARPRLRDGEGPQAGLGHVPVDRLDTCALNVLAALDASFNAKRSIAAPTVLFPLIGTGNAAGDARVISRTVIETIVEYVRANTSSRVGKVLISAYSDLDLSLCREVMESLEADNKITPAAGAGRAR